MIVADTNLIAYLQITGVLSHTATLVLKKDPYWITPPLWQSEFRNLLAGYIRRGMLLEEAQEIMENTLQLLEGRQVAPSSNRVLALVANSSCKAYDCEFVALAEQLAIPLVTADKQLLRTFPDIAVSLEEFATP